MVKKKKPECGGTQLPELWEQRYSETTGLHSHGLCGVFRFIETESKGGPVWPGGEKQGELLGREGLILQTKSNQNTENHDGGTIGCI